MKSLLLSATLLILTSQAHSMTFGQSVDHVVKQTSAMPNKNLKTFSFEPSSCTNFTGTWSGSCVISAPEGDQTKQVTTVISQQRCSSLTIDSDHITLGSVVTKSSSQAFVTTQTSTIYDWNHDASELNASVDFLVKVTLPQGQMIKPQAAGRLYIENGVLRTDFRSPNSSVSCSFTKP